MSGGRRDANEGCPHPSPTSAMASRWSRRNVLTFSLARHRSAVAMVIDALASALVALWSGPSTWAAPAVASSNVSWSRCRRAVVL